MSGIYVENMRMPTGCVSCDFADYGTTDPFCRRLMRTITRHSERMQDCPVHFVPDHGDLIDRSAMLAGLTDVSIRNWNGHFFLPTPAKAVREETVRAAPAVIPGDKETGNG